MHRRERPNIPTKSNNDSVERFKILAKKGYLSAHGVTSGVTLLLYSGEFQLGVLLNLPMNDSRCASESDEHLFAQSAIEMIVREFQALGVRKRDLVSYAIGGSCADGSTEAAQVKVQRTLWNHGLKLSASDLGGRQVRSIWMDVETGRTIIRSEQMQARATQGDSQLSAAS